MDNYGTLVFPEQVAADFVRKQQGKSLIDELLGGSDDLRSQIEVIIKFSICVSDQIGHKICCFFENLAVYYFYVYCP